MRTRRQEYTTSYKTIQTNRIVKKMFKKMTKIENILQLLENQMFLNQCENDYNASLNLLSDFDKSKILDKGETPCEYSIFKNNYDAPINNVFSFEKLEPLKQNGLGETKPFIQELNEYKKNNISREESNTMFDSEIIKPLNMAL